MHQFKYFQNKESNFIYGKKEINNKEHVYFIHNDYYKINLYSNKINSNCKMSIKDNNNLVLIGKCIDENNNLNKDNFYLYLRLKTSTNKEFLRWWNENNFTIEIEIERTVA